VPLIPKKVPDQVEEEYQRGTGYHRAHKDNEAGGHELHTTKHRRVKSAVSASSGAQDDVD